MVSQRGQYQIVYYDRTSSGGDAEAQSKHALAGFRSSNIPGRVFFFYLGEIGIERGLYWVRDE